MDGGQRTEPPEITLARATLYNTAVNIGMLEARLVWARYAAFLVLNGFLVNALGNAHEHAASFAITGAIGAIGLPLNGIWFILNGCGWHNQRVAYARASRVFPFGVDLLTDEFRDGAGIGARSHGPIYWCAQTVPIVFALLSAGALGVGIEREWPVSTPAILIALGVFAVMGVIVQGMTSSICRSRAQDDKVA